MAASQSASSVLRPRPGAAAIVLLILFTAARSLAQHHEPGEPSLCTVQYGANGTVTDALTGEPIAGAHVIVNAILFAESAADGSFAVSAERAEACNVDYYVEVVVQADGYEIFRDGLYTSMPLRHLDVRLGGDYTPTAVAPSPTPTPTPGVDPCALPTAPQCPIGTEPECFANDHCVGCTCRPCGVCPPGYHILEEVNECICTNDFHRVSGFVAESPPCEGRMRGMTVRLDPFGENITAVTDDDGSFEFPSVATGEHTLTIEPRCNELGCWDPVTVEVVDEDESVAICPREGDDVRVNVDRASGTAGSTVQFAVRLDSGARPVAGVSHTIGFDVDAPIVASSDATPDCTLNPDLDAEAVFAFEPAGCTPGTDCAAVRAEIDSAGAALPDGVLYQCRAEVPEVSNDLCSNALHCGDLALADPSGAPLQGTCADGAIVSALPAPELSFRFELTPEHPSVGEAVELRVTVSGAGGLPQYRLSGAAPVLSGDTSSRSVSSFGTVVYDLVAAENGTASLVMSVNFETELGCPGHTYFGFTSDVSDPFLVVVGDGEGVTPTPTPTPTPAVPCPTATPIHCDFGGAFPQCSSEPSDGGACPHVTCHCVDCPPCPEGQVFERLPQLVPLCRCDDAVLARRHAGARRQLAAAGERQRSDRRRKWRQLRDRAHVERGRRLVAGRGRAVDARDAPALGPLHRRHNEGRGSSVSARLQGVGFVFAVLLAAVPARAHTPTHTDGPTPTPTPTGTVPPPRAVVTVRPNPARSGQHVVLDGGGSRGGFAFEWSQTGGDVDLQIENADTIVAGFVVPPLSAPDDVRVRLDVQGGTPAEATIALLPPDTVRLEVGEGTGAPGYTVDIGVVLRTLGYSVTELRHELAFDGFAAVAGSGRIPDCSGGQFLTTESAEFAFLPENCTPDVDCTGISAHVVTRDPIPDGAVAYRCNILSHDQVAPTSCFHALVCGDGDASTASGAALAVDCVDGGVNVDYSVRPVRVTHAVEPADPMVGDAVRLTFVVEGEGGNALYSLVDAMPFLRVVQAPPPRSGSMSGTFVFDTVAECAGLARISLGLAYEARCGCSASPNFCRTSSVSESFPLAVREPGGFIVSGRVAEFPLGCAGAMRGVEVRLDPIGRTTETSLSDGHFSFGEVPPGDYMLSVSPSCNPFGCWAAQPIHVGDADVEVEFCPQGIVEERCDGDCDENGRVEIDELIAQVSIALGAENLTCADADSNFDGAVAIDDLTRAIGNAIEGCP